MREPVIAHGVAIALDVGVLLRLSWLDEFDVNTTLLGRRQRHAADVFRPISAKDRLWPAEIN